MKVKELIEKLQEFDLEMEVRYSDYEFGNTEITQIAIENYGKGYFVYIT